MVWEKSHLTVFLKFVVRANFEFINKLGVDRWCFHDRDIAPDGKTLAVCHYSFSVFDDLSQTYDISNKFYRLIVNAETLVLYSLNMWCLLHHFFGWELIFVTSYDGFSPWILELIDANFFCWIFFICTNSTVIVTVVSKESTHWHDFDLLSIWGIF